jgi:GTP 3',8-cyclase
VLGQRTHLEENIDRSRAEYSVDSNTPDSAVRVYPSLTWKVFGRRSANLPGPLMPPAQSGQQLRIFSTSNGKRKENPRDEGPRLTHVSESGSARMVSIAEKSTTERVAIAACKVRFSNGIALDLIKDNQMKKGDVLGVARVAGIMAAKRTPDLIPLCHPIGITHVSVDLEPLSEDKEIEVRATVSCVGQTGVEMEALTAASTAALTVYDMCKAVDKGMIIDGLRVVLKDGGKSGRWEMP